MTSLIGHRKSGQHHGNSHNHCGGALYLEWQCTCRLNSTQTPPWQHTDVHAYLRIAPSCPSAASTSLSRCSCWVFSASVAATPKGGLADVRGTPVFFSSILSEQLSIPTTVCYIARQLFLLKAVQLSKADLNKQVYKYSSLHSRVQCLFCSCYIYLATHLELGQGRNLQGWSKNPGRSQMGLYSSHQWSLSKDLQSKGLGSKGVLPAGVSKTWLVLPLATKIPNRAHHQSLWKLGKYVPRRVKWGCWHPIWLEERKVCLITHLYSSLAIPWLSHCRFSSQATSQTSEVLTNDAHIQTIGLATIAVSKLHQWSQQCRCGQLSNSYCVDMMYNEFIDPNWCWAKKAIQASGR